MDIFLEWRGDEQCIGKTEDLFHGESRDIRRLLTVAITDIVGNIMGDEEFESSVNISLR